MNRDAKTVQSDSATKTDRD